MVKQVVIMGGAFGYSYAGPKIETNVWTGAEANISGDPIAADTVINAGWKVTLIPLDVTIRTVMTKEYLDSLPGKDGELIRAITQQTYVNASGATPVHDSSAIFYALRPSAYTTIDGVIRVVTEGPAVGQTLISRPDSKNPSFQGRPVNKVAVEVNAPMVLDFYRKQLGSGH